MITVGIDLVDVDRFRAVLERRPSLAARVFTAEEREALSSHVDPVPSLAARFAAKEAAMKALGVGLGAVDFGDIEVRRTPSGAPELIVRGRAARRAAALGLNEWSVSLSHVSLCASAVVVAS